MDEPRATVEPERRLTAGWRPVSRSDANELTRRRRLDRRHVVGSDPHCQACGHRAIRHGLDGLRPEEQGRWFHPEATACQWRPPESVRPGVPLAPPCPCPTWEPPSTFASSGVESEVGLVLAPDTWIEVQLGHDWIAAYRLVADHGRAVVGEVRLFPAETWWKRPLGGWSGELLGVRACVPQGGITTRLLRGVRVRAYLRSMSEWLARFRAKHPEHARFFGWGDDPERVRLPQRHGRGRKGRPHRFYAQLAAEYVRAVNGGSHRPIADVARRRRLPSGRVRDMIRRARQLELLPEGVQGRAEGQLTAAAEALLAPAGARRSGSPLILPPGNSRHLNEPGASADPLRARARGVPRDTAGHPARPSRPRVRAETRRQTRQPAPRKAEGGRTRAKGGER
jgi:hypothetical protein